MAKATLLLYRGGGSCSYKAIRIQKNLFQSLIIGALQENTIQKRLRLTFTSLRNFYTYVSKKDLSKIKSSSDEEINNDWYNDIVKEIDNHKGRFSKRDYKKYKLDLLLRVATRVASFSADCAECQNFQRKIKKLVEVLGDLGQSSKEERKSYFRTKIGNITIIS